MTGARLRSKVLEPGDRTAAIGVAAGLGLYLVAIAVTAIAFATLAGVRLLEW